MKTEFEPYLPSPEVIVKLYETLDKGESLDLDWRNPGRRPPTPAKIEQPAEAEQTLQEEENKDFDFDEEGLEGLLVTPQRRLPGSELKGSARKQTTSLTSVLSNMKRHRQIEEMDQKEAIAATPPSSR